MSADAAARERPRLNIRARGGDPFFEAPRARHDLPPVARWLFLPRGGLDFLPVFAEPIFPDAVSGTLPSMANRRIDSHNGIAALVGAD